MSRNQRFSLMGLAVVVLVVAFVVARSGNTSDSSSSSDTSTQSASGDNGTGGSTTPAKPAVATVTVKNAKPVGGIKRLTFKHNGRIVFVVKSDTADEVHFHGYDIGKDVAAGGSVKFDTKANIEGRFEVELENHKEQIAEVEVTP